MHLTSFLLVLFELTTRLSARIYSCKDEATTSFIYPCNNKFCMTTIRKREENVVNSTDATGVLSRYLWKQELVWGFSTALQRIHEQQISRGKDNHHTKLISAINVCEKLLKLA